VDRKESMIGGRKLYVILFSGAVKFLGQFATDWKKFGVEVLQRLRINRELQKWAGYPANQDFIPTSPSMTLIINK
jgi:hypothetical protein